MLINELTAKFSNYMRPNLYEVTFLPTFASEYGSELTLLCTEATLPFFTSITKQQMINNQKQNIIQDFDFDPANFVFNVDADNKLLEIITRWLGLQRNFNNQLGYKNQYQGTILINLLDTKMNILYSSVLYKAFPVNVNDVALSYSQNDAVMQLSTSFVFDNIEYFLFDEINANNASYITHRVARQVPYLSADYLQNIVENAALTRLKSKVGSYLEKNTSVYSFGESFGVTPVNQKDSAGAIIDKLF